MTGPYPKWLPPTHYNFEMPPIAPSSRHTVLIETMFHAFPNVSPYRPGVHVLMPYQESSDYAESKYRWSNIKNCLNNLIQTPINSSYQLQEIILFYNKKYKNKWQFDLLHHVIVEVLSEEHRSNFFNVTLPDMARLALELPQLLPRPLPLLSCGLGAHISLSQRQIAALMAHAFFCTYPRRNNPNNQFANYPTINFNGLFQFHPGRSAESSVAKLLCILNYFRRVTSKVPGGAVTFTRRCIPNKSQPGWKNSNKLLRIQGLQVHQHKSIEDDGNNMLQVTFANKRYGGGVLGSGCVQEEIRCITCPEMIITRLFSETLGDDEALLVTGVERYCDYKGYASSFRFNGDYIDETPRDGNGRVLCSVVAIDAIKFYQPRPENQEVSLRRSLLCCFGRQLRNNTANSKFPNVNDQYKPSFIDRELNKAYIGFQNPEPNDRLVPVASGNWGCGVFKGDPALKFLLQLLATSEAERDLHYFTFGDAETLKIISELKEILFQGSYTVGKLYSVLNQYHKNHVNGDDLLKYISQELRGKRLADGTLNSSLAKRPKMSRPEDLNTRRNKL